MAVLPACAQYAGPAILSRGEAPAAMGAPQISFRPYLELTGVYDTGLTGVAVNSNGEIGNQDSYGVEVTGGISGIHSWKHTMLALDYRGSYRHYTQQTYYDGSDQSLMLGITHQFTRRTSLVLHENGGLFSGGFGLLGLPQTAQFDPSGNYIPNTDFYDNRTFFLATSANLIYQKTARLSFSFGGVGTLVERRSSALYGVIGASANADVQYRVSRRSTIGATYSYTHYDYIGVLSGADIHSAALTYATRLTRWWEITGFAGVARAESKFVRSVTLDPAIQALLGIQTATAISYGIRYTPNAAIRISRTFRRGVLYGAAGRGITPGNGLFLTSIDTYVNGGYTFTGLRRWSLGANISQDWEKSFGNLTGRYNTFSSGFTVSRQILGSVHFVAGAAARKYGSPDFSRYNRPVYDVRVGLGFTPGAVPLRIW